MTAPATTKPRRKAKAKAEEAPAGEEQTFAEIWATLPPGRASRGLYSVFKLPDGALGLVYLRVDDDQAAALAAARTAMLERGEEEQHLELPAGLIALQGQLAAGKMNPAQMVRALRELRGAGVPGVG